MRSVPSAPWTMWMASSAKRTRHSADPAVSCAQLTREPLLAPVKAGRLAPRPQLEEPVAKARRLGPDELRREVSPD